MFVGGRVGVGGRDGGIGGIYRGALVEVSLVLIVGIRLGVGRACVEAHGRGWCWPGSLWCRGCQGWVDLETGQVEVDDGGLAEDGGARQGSTGPGEARRGEARRGLSMAD